jgi:hypothetical protein
MRPEKVIVALGGVLFASSFATWAIGGAQMMRSVGIWLLFASAGVMGVPLLLLVAYTIVKAVRR